MKKKIFILLSVMALASASKAQNTVNATSFTTNPDQYRGMTISISGVELNTEDVRGDSFTVTRGVNTSRSRVKSLAAIPGGSTVSTGKGVSVPAAVKALCDVPKDYKIVDVNFPTDPTFKKCFIMKSSLYSTLPINQSAIKATINFKGESKIGYTITLIKLL